MRHEFDAIGQPSCPEPADAWSARGFGWRHLATVMLLLATLPVFAAAGLVALTVLPIILTVVGIYQLRQFLRPEPAPVQVRAGR